jgi:hypothetical protein
MCPLAESCNNTVSVSDLLWTKTTKQLLDGESCIHRFKYDSIHMGSGVETLKNVSGDTDFRYSNMTQYVPIDV